MGVKKGDVLGILSWNCLDYIDIFGAAMKCGLIASPYNPRLNADELTYLINYYEAQTLFVGTELIETANQLKLRLPKVKNYISLETAASGMISHGELLKTQAKNEPDIWVEEDDPFIIFYTSGTTGVPRGALYTHRRKMEDTRLFTLELALEYGNRELMAIPLFHVAGASYLFAFFFSAAANIIYPQQTFDPASFLQMIQDEQNDIHIVPTHLVIMLGLPEIRQYELNTLKRVWYAGSPMPVEILKRGWTCWVRFLCGSAANPAKEFR
jgi:acyl-CoA synthetase (AMP-forming)/AMP-acid ligase II